MKTFKVLLMSSALILSALSASIYAQDKTNAASMQDLLKQLENQRYRDTKENRQREKAFKADKTQQQKMLKNIRAEQAKQESIGAKLEKQFDQLDAKLSESEARLKERMGSLSELFGHLTTAAGDAQAQDRVSLISVHYPERGEFFQQLVDVSASTSELPNIEQIDQLFIEMQRELIEQGRVVNFTANVSDASGVGTEQNLTRMGNFNVVDAQGNYLTQQKGELQQLARQPSAYVALTSAFVQTNENFSAVGIDPTGPSGGSLLAALINTPSLVERWHQGGIVGMVISVLGVIAILVGLLRLLVLTGTGSKVSKQLKSVDTPNEKNPLGRVLAQAAKYQQADLETLELKMNESIIKELPSLQRFESFLKITAAVAPLLGLLGTVVGMILTFQAITIYGAGDPQAMAGGISSALVTTVLGLVVAIPTLLMHSFVSSKSGNIIHVLEEQAAGLVADFNEKQA
jgi:biopolymer transport protein ExbB